MATPPAIRYLTSLLSQTHRPFPAGGETQVNLLTDHLCARQRGNPTFLCVPVEFLYCDLASLGSVREFVRAFKAKKIPLHVLVNNGEFR